MGFTVLAIVWNLHFNLLTCQFSDDRRDHREQWEIDLLRPQEGMVIESVKEIHPGERKYEQYLHGQSYQRVDGGRRMEEYYDR